MVDPDEDRHIQSDFSFAMAAQWLQNCTEHHQQCYRHGSKLSMPTRLIDIRGLSKNSVKLVENVANEPYVALSHWWGNEGFPRTTLATLDQHRQSISLGSLSQTLREAISTVSRLGFHYIWIDALAIVQDWNEDWLAESSRMGNVYSGALFTLAVADAENHSEGMCREHEARLKDVFAESTTRGAGARSSLLLNGPCFKYRILATDLKSPIFKSWNRAKLNLNNGKWLLDREQKLPLDVLCVVLAEDDVAKVLVCMCLVPSEDDPDEWKRVGICHWDGLIHQIAGFTGKEPALKNCAVI
jgi:hypothetical protein